MKRFRLPLTVAAVVLGLLLVAVAVGFSSSFQTWAAQRALAAEPGWQGTIGRVSAGLHRVDVTDVRLERDGAVLKLPEATVELPLFSAAFRDKILISRLIAKGWTLDLAGWQPAASSNAGQASSGRRGADAPAPAKLLPAADGGSSAANAAGLQPPPNRPAFHGVFDEFQLPFDLALDGVDVVGEVVLPAARGGARITITGGGLSPGQVGRFSFQSDVRLADPQVSTVGVRGTISAAMDSARTLARLRFQADASAAGAQFPEGVKLAASGDAARDAGGETYAIRVTSKGRELLNVEAALPRDARRLGGAWKIDAQDADLTPFAFGKSLPTFTVTGEGRFETDVTFATIRASGRIAGNVARLELMMPQLSEVGAVTLAADFDVARGQHAITIQTFAATVANDRPIATVRGLQPFEISATIAEVRPADAARDLLGIILHGVPVAWVRPFLGDLVLDGGDVQGELVAMARADGGTSVRTKAPLRIADASLSERGKPVLHGVDISLGTSADYSPQGWQAEVTELSAKVGDTTLLALSAKAGRLAGKDQPLKTTGQLTADLPALMAQPFAAGTFGLTAGEAAIDFVASFAAKKQLQAKLALTKLAAPAPIDAPATAAPEPSAAGAAKTKLPNLTANIRADIAPNGQLTLNAPILIDGDGRQSDLTIAGMLTRVKDVHKIDAHVTSTQVVIDDATLLAALLPPETKSPSDEKGPAIKPPWAGLEGTLVLQLKKIVYSDSFQVNDMAGTLRLDDGAVKLDDVRMGVGEGAARLNGAVTFHPAEARPYGLAAKLEVRDFDPGPLFTAFNPSQAPTVEGRFDLNSDFASRADTVAALAAGAGGEFELTSRGGVFRGIPLDASNFVENTSWLAGWIASAGSALGALTRKKDYDEVASKAQALAELANGLNPMPFDQLAVVVSRDAQLNTALRNFTLISPEIRLTGNGRAIHVPGSSLLDDALAVEFTLRARGRQGDLLKYLGVLETQTDDLGYAACTLPVKVGGTLGKPDASEFNDSVAALALEKSGLTDKATELFNRIRRNNGN